jgi:hypothetical protein
MQNSDGCDCMQNRDGCDYVQNIVFVFVDYFKNAVEAEYKMNDTTVIDYKGRGSTNT